MKTSLSIGLLCGLFFLLVGLHGFAGESRPPALPSAAAQDTQAEESITVHLASGRTFTARVDPRTDAAQLWLRWEHGSAVLQRPIRWDRVVRAEVAGEEISGPQLRQIVQTIRRDASPPDETAATRKRLELAPSVTPIQPAPIRPNSPTGDAAPEWRRVPPPIRSVAIEAWVANWDGDVEVDGLIVHVYPLDAAGATVPVRGVLEVDLQGQRHGALKRRQSFIGLGRWVRSVRPEDFGPSGVIYRLPFQSVHPEFDLAADPYGAVHVRLSVPGHGTFDATQSMVRIRPYSAIRDDWQQATGRRFFPQERTGRSRR